MSKLTPRQAVMVGVVTLLGTAVVADRVGWLRGSDNEGAPTDRYSMLVEEVAARQRLIAQRDNWRRAVAEAGQEWDRLKDRVIIAGSAALAEGRLRDEVNHVATSLGLDTPTSASLTLPQGAGSGGTTAKDSGVRNVGLRLEFGSMNTETVYTFIDRIENLPNIATNISMIEMKGPGVAQMPTRIDVIVELRAMAVIGAEG